MGEKVYTCPECGEQSMVKKAGEPGWYLLHCNKCEAERGPFLNAEDKSVA
ncbi:MAG: hypothetical protein V3W22_00265 [Thermoplasmata archaeon]